MPLVTTSHRLALILLTLAVCSSLAGEAAARPLRTPAAPPSGLGHPSLSLRGAYGWQREFDFDHSWHLAAAIRLPLIWRFDTAVDANYLRRSGFRGIVDPDFKSGECPDCGFFYDTPLAYALTLGGGLRLNILPMSKRNVPYVEAMPGLCVMGANPRTHHKYRVDGGFSESTASSSRTFGIGWFLRAGLQHALGNSASSLDLGIQYVNTPDFRNGAGYDQQFPAYRGSAPGFKQVSLYAGLAFGR